MTGWHKVFAAVTLSWALAIAWGSLTPASDLPQNLPWDKFNHFIAYTGLAGGLCLSGLRPSIALAGAIVFSIVIEYLQLVVPGRSGGDWADILANALGALAAILGVNVGRRFRR